MATTGYVHPNVAGDDDAGRDRGAVGDAVLAGTASDGPLSLVRRPGRRNPGYISDRIAVDGALTVAEFLRWCAVALDEHRGIRCPSTRIPAVPGALEAFLAGGIAAVQAATVDEVWLQYGLTLPPAVGTRHATLYRAVAGTLRTLLAGDLVHDTFFMHKPPGIRLRMRTDLAGRRDVDEVLHRALNRWTELRLITGWRPSVYEPERTLFGGPVSMRSVHRVFTADSVAWLDFHGMAEPGGPAWAMSLLMIQTLFAGLEIVGWEDRDVWARLRRQAGRVVTPAVHQTGAVDRLTPVLRRHWHNAEATRAMLAPPVQDLLDEYTAAVRDEAPRWMSEYFTTPGAALGPRAVAALMIVFHWNRAGLPAHRQALFAEALAAPPGDLDDGRAEPGSPIWTRHGGPDG